MRAAVPASLLASVLACSLLVGPRTVKADPAAAQELLDCPAGRWQLLRRGAGIDNDYINAIGFGPDGTGWLATNALFPVETHGGGLTLVAPDGGLAREQRSGGRLRSDTVSAVAAGDGVMLVGSLAGAALAQPGPGGVAAWLALPTDAGGAFPVRDVTAVLADSRGDAWFATTFGLARQGATGWSFYGQSEGPDGLRSRFISALAEGPAGTIWVGTYGDGLWRFQEGQDEPWTQWSAADGLGNDYVHTLLWHDETLWVGTGIGLTRFTPAEGRFVRSTPADSPMQDEDVRALAVQGERVWIGTHQGLHWIEGERWGHCPVVVEDPPAGPVPGLSHPLVVSLGAHPDGSLWVGTFGGGLHIFRPEQP